MQLKQVKTIRVVYWTSGRTLMAVGRSEWKWISGAVLCKRISYDFRKSEGENAEHKLGLVLNPVLLIFDCQHINRELYSLGQLLGKWLSPEGQTHADNQLLFFCMCPSFFRCSSESPSPFRAVLLGRSIGHLVKNSHHSFPDFSRFFYKHSSMPEKKTHTSFTLITVGGCVGVVNPFGKLLCYPHGDYTLFPSIRDSLLTRGAKTPIHPSFHFTETPDGSYS